MKLAVVVPTLNEAANLAETLSSLPSDAHIVVSDGGSSDDTLAIASRHRVTIVTGERGRARQMNAGARVADADAIVFVHADCSLGDNARGAIERALTDPDVAGGAFRLEIRDAGASLRWIAATSNFRARYLQTPYGDQAIFVRRSALETIGGFPDVPFMEDVALVRKLRSVGKIVRVDEPVTTGKRHWEPLGPFRTTLLNWAMVTLFLLGVSADTLAPHYRRLRSPRSESKAAVHPV